MLRTLLTRVSALTRTQTVDNIKVVAKAVAMPRLSVRSVPGDERVQISFVYSAEAEPGGTPGKERVFNFDRLQTEELGKTLARINSNVSKIVNRKKKKNKSPTEASSSSPEADELQACLYNREAKISDGIPNKDAWKEGAELVVGSTRYVVQVNPPSVRSLTLPETIMVGVPVYPKIDAEFVDLDACSITWYKEEKLSADAGDVTPVSGGSACDLTRELPRSRTELTNRDWKIGTPVQRGEVRASTSEASNLGQMEAGPPDETARAQSQSPSPSLGPKVPKKSKRRVNGSMTNLNWMELQRSVVYTPTEHDVGHKLRLICSPSDGTRVGEEVEVVTSDVIQGPGRCPFEDRHLLTKKRAEKGSFRAMTYNVLADLYADSDFSREHLYPYCPPYALQADYRRQLLIKEIIGYKADVMCLQEVDRRLFISDLIPALAMEGLEGRFRPKAGSLSEGSAIFWSTDKFKCISECDIHLTETLQKDPSLAYIYDKVRSKEGLMEKLQDRRTTLQVCVLQSVEDPSQHVVTATTHLYFRPRASNIRLLQVAVCLEHLSALMATLKEEGAKPSLVFAGDFNTTPNHGVFELITRGHLQSHHADWYAGGKEELVSDLELRHNLRLGSAAGTPAYTNYVTSFAACLDYIFVSTDTLQTQRIIPLPPHEDVTRFTALPNPVFPSDHLALVCDLMWH